MKQTHIMILVIALLVLQFGLNHAIAGKEIYDDFSSNYIDGSKWRQRTFVREITDGQYISNLGNRTPGMGAEVAPGIFRNNLDFVNPNSIYAIECEITIVDTKLDSASDSKSFARIAGYFYNKNDTGGATGDIFAQLMIGDRGNGGLETFWEVQDMLTDDTRTWNVIGSDTIIPPGTLKYNTPYKAKISYDGDRTFSFFVNGVNGSYIGPVKKRVAIASWKGISSAINATNGSNNGFVFAKFDNVYINNQLTIYEDFSTSPLDKSRWKQLEFVREISNGSLRSNIQGVDSQYTANTYLSASDAPYVEAKVFIDSNSQLSPGAFGLGRMQGYYYNDSRGPGSGQDYNKYEGDVFVQVQLKYDSDGTLKALAYVHRSNDENEGSFTELFSHNFIIPINLDTFYTLSIRFKGKKLIFGCNSESAEYNINTPIYPAYGEHRLLRSRVVLDPGETGYLKARFDDVYIEKKGKTIPSIPLLLLDD